MTGSEMPGTEWLIFARQVITAAVGQSDKAQSLPAAVPSRPHGGVFVTLHKGGRLRGCMGTLDPSLPLGEAIRSAAISAATQDPRFPAVTPAELAALTVEISILSEGWPMESLDDLQLGRHGILVQRGMQRGLFLPQVATEHHLDKVTFLSRCCSEKAGLPPDAWKDPDVEVLLFTAEVLREP